MMEARRSGNFGPSIWDDDYIQSLTTPYGDMQGREYVKKAEKLKMQVKMVMDGTTDQLEQLELIDCLQRFDISNHFEERVQKMLESFYRTDEPCPVKYMHKDLHVAALKFRLLRQYGYHVPQEVFCSFMDDEGNFKACLADDVRGLLSLYEASFLSVEGELMLDLAKDFCTHHLTQWLEKIIDAVLVKQIEHALELPLHWRVQKLETYWFIQVYEGKSDANLILLELAKLDFNMVQARYQDEIKRMSRWYKETGLAENLRFARHRLPECFLCALIH